MKIITINKYAGYEYFTEDTFEAGVALNGNEVKSIRAGNANIKDSFCFIRGDNAVIKNMHISPYDKANTFNVTDAKRDRALLLHKYEIRKIAAKIDQKGYTLIPLKLYFKDSLVKIELGLCRGKHSYDKKQAIIEKDKERAAERELKNYK